LDFGTALKLRRKEAGISQEELAERIYKSRSSISKIENNKESLEAETLIQWVHATQIQAQELAVVTLCSVDAISIVQSISETISATINFIFLGGII